MHGNRDFIFVHGMKEPSFRQISTRQILDEIELQGPVTEKGYLATLIEAMDSIVLAKPS